MEFSDMMAGFGDLDQLFNDIGWDFDGPVSNDTFAQIFSPGSESLFNDPVQLPNLGFTIASPSGNALTPGIKSEPMTEYPAKDFGALSTHPERNDVAMGGACIKPQNSDSHQILQRQPHTSMDPPPASSAAQIPLLHRSTFDFQPLSTAIYEPGMQSITTLTTSTPCLSAPHSTDPYLPAPAADPFPRKAVKAKRIRNNVGPKHQLEELQQVVAQKNQQIAQLLQENVRLKDTTRGDEPPRRVLYFTNALCVMDVTCRILELVIQCRNHQVTRLQQGIQSQDATGIATTPLATDTASLAAYAQLTAPQLMATFKPVLNDMSVALLAAEDPSNAAGAAALAALMANFHFVVQHVSLANTEILKTVGMTLSADSPENSDTHWSAVAISLNLSPKQQADSIILHDLYMRWTGRINAERHQYSCLLSQAMETSSKSHERAYFVANQAYQSNDAELMEKMHKTVVQDRCLILLVGEVLTTRIMTHKQWARAVVQSYPFVLDVWALLRAVSGLYRTGNAS